MSNSEKDSLFYDGIVERGTNTIIAENNIYQVGQSGIYSSSCNGTQVLNNVCANNHNAGIDFGANAPVDGVHAIRNVTISDNLCRENKHMGINVTNAEGCYLRCNTSIDNGDACIAVEGRSTNCRFINNHCRSKNRGISFGLQISNCIAINTVSNCDGGLVHIPSDCSDSVKDYPYNKVNTECVSIDVPLNTSDAIASQTVLEASVDDSMSSQYWYANKPVTLRASKASGDFQKLAVGDFVAKNQITDSIWANNFIRLPQGTWTAAGAIWFNPQSKKLEYYNGEQVVTLATE